MFISEFNCLFCRPLCSIWDDYPFLRGVQCSPHSYEICTDFTLFLTVFPLFPSESALSLAATEMQCGTRISVLPKSTCPAQILPRVIFVSLHIYQVSPTDILLNLKLNTSKTDLNTSLRNLISFLCLHALGHFKSTCTCLLWPWLSSSMSRVSPVQAIVFPKEVQNPYIPLYLYHHHCGSNHYPHSPRKLKQLPKVSLFSRSPVHPPFTRGIFLKQSELCGCLA